MKCRLISNVATMTGNVSDVAWNAPAPKWESAGAAPKRSGSVTRGRRSVSGETQLRRQHRKPRGATPSPTRRGRPRTLDSELWGVFIQIGH